MTDTLILGLILFAALAGGIGTALVFSLRRMPKRNEPVVTRSQLEDMFKPKYRRDSRGRFMGRGL